MALSDVASHSLRRALANNVAGSEIETLLESASAAQIATLTVTPGTAAASKAVVLGASKEIATITTATITNLASTAITVSTTGITLDTGADLIFSGTTGQNEITVTDNLADALSVKIAAGNDFLILDSTDTNEKLHVAAHASMKLGFFAVTPAVRQSAYTQTYATADKTHAAPTAAALTVTDGAGTNDGTIGAITDNASTITAVQELADQINKLVADMADTKQLINAVIDDLQAYGLLA